MRPLPGMYRLRCFVRGHHWQTIIHSAESTHVKQRCLRCAHYRTHRLTDQERVKGMT